MSRMPTDRRASLRQSLLPPNRQRSLARVSCRHYRADTCAPTVSQSKGRIGDALPMSLKVSTVLVPLDIVGATVWCGIRTCHARLLVARLALWQGLGLQRDNIPRQNAAWKQSHRLCDRHVVGRAVPVAPLTQTDPASACRSELRAVRSFVAESGAAVMPAFSMGRSCRTGAVRVSSDRVSRLCRAPVIRRTSTAPCMTARGDGRPERAKRQDPRRSCRPTKRGGVKRA